MKKESSFQKDIKRRLRGMFPGCIVQKNDENDIQGFPDLTIIYGDRWATLECKRSKNDPHRPNQDYWVNKLNEMSFSRFIYPENKDEVLNELQRTFETARSTRIPRSK